MEDLLTVFIPIFLGAVVGFLTGYGVRGDKMKADKK
jgi:hypothetical protein